MYVKSEILQGALCGPLVTPTPSQVDLSNISPNVTYIPSVVSFGDQDSKTEPTFKNKKKNNKKN